MRLVGFPCMESSRQTVPFSASHLQSKSFIGTERPSIYPPEQFAWREAMVVRIKRSSLGDLSLAYSSTWRPPPKRRAKSSRTAEQNYCRHGMSSPKQQFLRLSQSSIRRSTPSCRRYYLFCKVVMANKSLESRPHGKHVTAQLCHWASKSRKAEPSRTQPISADADPSLRVSAPRGAGPRGIWSRRGRGTDRICARPRRGSSARTCAFA